jgi:hypothetical protein
MGGRSVATHQQHRPKQMGSRGRGPILRTTYYGLRTTDSCTLRAHHERARKKRGRAEGWLRLTGSQMATANAGGEPIRASLGEGASSGEARRRRISNPRAKRAASGNFDGTPSLHTSRRGRVARHAVAAAAQSCHLIRGRFPTGRFPKREARVRTKAHDFVRIL